MKQTCFLLLSLIVFSCSSQSSLTTAVHQRPKIYLDENGGKLSQNAFQKKWRDKENNLMRWDYATADSGRVAKLHGPLYSRLTVPYSTLKSKIEEITGRSFPDNITFLFNYIFTDDLCSNLSTNNWDKEKIKDRKAFTSPWKTAIEKEYEDLGTLHFFEEGIRLENEIPSPDEYYFEDRENFLRKNIFLSPTLCGSMAVIKPNGQILVRNGEYAQEDMAQHIHPQNWSLFFT